MSDGFSLFARRWKLVEKAERTIVCIHGFGGHSGILRRLGESLAVAAIEVWGLDLRGFGNSTEPDLPRGDTKNVMRHMQDINEAVNLIREKSQSQKLYVLGHSLGGLYALWYGASYPDCVDGLILASPAVENKPRMKPEDREKMPFLFATAPETMIETRSVVPSDFVGEVGKELRAQILLRTSRFSVRYLVGLGKFLMRDKVFLNAAEVRSPTLILQGDADEEALPSGAERLFESLAVQDKTLKVIPGADHSLYGAMNSLELAENEPEKRAQVFTTIIDWLITH
jgi:alpha-beta hydrolase superfamily lysophospholipase